MLLRNELNSAVVVFVMDTWTILHVYTVEMDPYLLLLDVVIQWPRAYFHSILYSKYEQSRKHINIQCEIDVPETGRRRDYLQRMPRCNVPGYSLFQQYNG